MSAFRIVYGVYKDGELVAKGFCTEIREMFNISSNYLYICASKGKEIDGHIIKLLGREKWKPGLVKKRFDPVDYLYRHLKEYGNTVMKDDPSPYIEEVENMLGGKIDVLKRLDTGDPYNFEASITEPNKYRKGRKEIYYILELRHGLSAIQK